jgi:hypothetical protein
MTIRERIDLLARAYPKFFPRKELLRLVREQLGDLDALDRWISRDGVRVRARAPKRIHHICAGNLAVSAFTSIAHGLILGAHNLIKLPSPREDSAARREILDFINGLPAPLRQRVETQNQLDDKSLQRADAVIAFGSDETMQNIRAKLRPGQKFLAHGHAVSFLWLALPNELSPRAARACAIDVLTYDQLGCLSPQAIYFPPGGKISELGDQLAHALELEWQAQPRKPARPLSIAARIAEARDVAHALGHRVWLPPKKHLGWTLIHDPHPAFELSPLHGVIYLRQSNETKLSSALASVTGKISTIGIAGKISRRAEKAFLDLGVTRFCPAGKMQFPPLTWHHDGHAPLADLVTWVDAEGEKRQGKF